MADSGKSMPLDEFLDKLVESGDLSVTKEQMIEELKAAGMLDEDGLPTQKAIDLGLLEVEEGEAVVLEKDETE